MLTKSNADGAKQLWDQAQHDADSRFRLYEYLAKRTVSEVCSDPQPSSSGSKTSD